MAQGPESKFREKLKKALVEKYGKNVWIIGIPGTIRSVGLPDWLVLFRAPYAVCFIELKAGDNMPTPKQLYTLEKLNSFGFSGMWVREISGLEKIEVWVYAYNKWMCQLMGRNRIGRKTIIDVSRLKSLSSFLTKPFNQVTQDG